MRRKRPNSVVSQHSFHFVNTGSEMLRRRAQSNRHSVRRRLRTTKLPFGSGAPVPPPHTCLVALALGAGRGLQP